MTISLDSLRRALRLLPLHALAAACWLVPQVATAQSAAQADLAGTAGGAARVIAPAAPALRAGAAGSAARPPTAAAAQSARPLVGKIVGTLADGTTGELLVGGQVAVQGLPLGNVSDETGRYFINNVPLGRQVITVEYLGYEPASRAHDVEPGAANTVDFALTPTPIELDEVLVEEEVAVDLSEYATRTPRPSFRTAPVRAVGVEKPDTTDMEAWHRSWRNFTAVHAIEYPMLNERVYFRMPTRKPFREEGRDASSSQPAAASAPPRRAGADGALKDGRGSSPAASARAPKRSTSTTSP